jgi:hypothetical protein
MVVVAHVPAVSVVEDKERFYKRNHLTGTTSAVLVVPIVLQSWLKTSLPSLTRQHTKLVCLSPATFSALSNISSQFIE